ncbi:large subunit GTPase 1 homolog [Lingula anatina]|uniref:Large subunit GTPase 1 homolog n=1 Tax=Lingula anatina TaxID=7574 RepID=A0A1S3IS04_LINAN|nr:large subunit GTPase 1 homolog [Lingula anatina]|eukprot:XP_013400853.1 large subunit GTPase 1 homolog [Lingula anatina]
MGKKNKEPSLGRHLIKERFGKQRKKVGTDSFLHTSELSDGFDWGRLNLQSVTEQSNLDEFLATAELAGTEFTAEKLNVKLITVDRNSGLLTEEEQTKVTQVQEENKQLLRIPRRPQWDETTTKSELEQAERESFLVWRKHLALLQEKEHILMTPFEKNLDFWRQLWRVIERSDILIQIVDARNPLLFRCVDLEKYVKEVNTEKVNMVLVNKADFLTDKQREMWSEYFSREGVRVAFWSAVEEMRRLQELEEKSDENGDTASDGEGEEESDSDESETSDQNPERRSCRGQQATSGSQINSAVEGGEPYCSGTDGSLKGATTNLNHEQKEVCNLTDDISKADCSTSDGAILSTDNCSCDTVTTENNDSSSTKCDENSARETCVHNSSKLLNGEELLELFKTVHEGKKVTEGILTVGLVGYPNVGKSSTINALLHTKKVSVSDTPGKTKHFQTLYVEPSLMLCDCPGLVMPTFVSTKAELILSGILPIDQMRDHVPPTSLLLQQIPRRTLEAIYGILIPRPMEGEDENRPPKAEEFLNSYGCN